jgi:hypothetical protein
MELAEKPPRELLIRERSGFFEVGMMESRQGRGGKGIRRNLDEDGSEELESMRGTYHFPPIIEQMG